MDSADRRDPEGEGGTNGGGASGLVDETLRADLLFHGLDKLLGLVTRDAEELLALLEELEGGMTDGRLPVAKQLLGLRTLAAIVMNS